MEIVPWLLCSGKFTRKIAPQAPRAARAGVPPEVASVSPVAVKKKLRKCEPGRNNPFSGRLKGVAPAALASAFALKAGQLGAHPVESCTFTHFTGQLVPGVFNLSWATAKTSAWTCAADVPPKTTGLPSMVTCKACRTPP